MRTSRRSVRSGPHRLLVIAVTTLWLVAGCAASAAPTPIATPKPTATPFAFATPWPPLTAPARADDVYLALLADDIVVSPINADAGVGGKDPVKRIHATYEGWPLTISQYKTAKSLAGATNWAAGAKPGRGEAPIALIGENILVTWGPPATATAPDAPDADRLASAGRLRDALERLVGPLKTRTIAPLPDASPVGSAGASAGPSATP